MSLNGEIWRTPLPSEDSMPKSPEGDTTDLVVRQVKIIHELRTELEALKKFIGCTRSHPHELMSPECELRTEIARLTNELTRLQQSTKQLVDSERESIAQYFDRQPGREFFGTGVADLIRNKRDNRDCGNCAHSEVRSQDEPCSQCIDIYNSSDLEFVHWKAIE